MQTIARQLQMAFAAAIADAFGVEADPLVAVAQSERFGDYQANAAMGLAKRLKSNPRTVAQQIVSKLNLGSMAEEVSLAGPGFINVRLSPGWLAARLGAALTDSRLGIDRVPQPQTVVIDYSGPNVAKQMHVGHLRSTIIGDALARVVEFEGHRVIRQNHIGDWGTQFGMLIAFLRDQGAAGNADVHIADLEAFYRDAKQRFDSDPAFAEEARQTVVRLQAGGPEELALWRKICSESRSHFQPIYQRLGVQLTPADERGESFYNPMLRGVVEELKARGIAVESEGALAIFTEPGTTPLIIQKSDGGFLYGTTDLAALRYRVFELNANRIIYTHDSRQALHFSQVFAAARKAGWGEAVILDYAPFGTMLGADGRPFRSRSGDTIKLKDLLDEAEERAFAVVTGKNADLPEEQRRQIAHAIGIGAIKYADLSKDRVSDYLFSWEAMLALDGNTAPYLQYAYARIASIFRRAGITPEQAAAHAGSIRLESPYELAVAKQVLRLGEVIDVVSRELKPHHLTTYLYDLAGKFSGFFENCPVIQSEEPTRSSRLAVCAATAQALAISLELLGIEHPSQM